MNAMPRTSTSSSSLAMDVWSLDVREPGISPKISQGFAVCHTHVTGISRIFLLTTWECLRVSLVVCVCVCVDVSYWFPDRRK